MSISINDVRSKAEQINKRNGFPDAKYNTVGAILIGGNICGISINRVSNTSGGCVGLLHGATKKEAYYYLCGMSD